MKLIDLLTEISGEDAYNKYYLDVISKQEFNQIAMSDPGTKVNPNNANEILKIGPYTKLLIHIYKRGNLKLEDLPRVKDYLKYVYKHRIPIDHKNFTNLTDLYNLIKDYLVKDKQSNIHEIIPHLNPKEYVQLHNGAEWEIFQPKTERAACYLGSGTSWCTTWGSLSLNPEYKERTNYFKLPCTIFILNISLKGNCSCRAIKFCNQ